MGFLYLGGLTIQEVGGIMMMGLSIYGVVVISRSLCSRFYMVYSCTPHFCCFTKVNCSCHGNPKLIRNDNDLYLLVFHISSTVSILIAIFTNRN